MKKAFTLVELIVVVGIICILAAILIASFGGGTESARNALCLTNMRNLAAACQTYGMAHGYYPAAGSFEKIGTDESDGIRNIKLIPGGDHHFHEFVYHCSCKSRHTTTRTCIIRGFRIFALC